MLKSKTALSEEFKRLRAYKSIKFRQKNYQTNNISMMELAWTEPLQPRWQNKNNGNNKNVLKKTELVQEQL